MWSKQQIEQDLNIHVLNIITEKTLAKDISCECKYTFDGKKLIQITGRITINVYVHVKSTMYVISKDYIWNSTTCSCQNGRKLTNIMDDLAIACDET